MEGVWNLPACPEEGSGESARGQGPDKMTSMGPSRKPGWGLLVPFDDELVWAKKGS